MIYLSLFLVGMDISHAASGKVDPIITTSGSDTLSVGTGEIEKKWSSSTGKVDEKRSDDSDDTSVNTEEEEKIKQDINTYIIESYKVQWTKIIKDLSAKLTKTLPDPEDRKQAYEKIKASLEMRKKRTEKTKMSDTKKLILTEFLDHMIDLLDAKITELPQ